MRLADEILLLLTDDTTGEMTVPQPALERAVAAGALADLEAAGLATVMDVDGPSPDGSGLVVETGRVALTAASAERPNDPVHAATIEAYRGLQGRETADALVIIGRSVYPAVHRALADEGVLERRASATSMRPHTTWVTVDATPEQAVRSVLRHVIAGQDVTGEQRLHARLVVALLTAAGVVDADCRSFAVPNLLITDGSVLPTQGRANPALTIMSVAARAADHLIRSKN